MVPVPRGLLLLLAAVSAAAGCMRAATAPPPVVAPASSTPRLSSHEPFTCRASPSRTPIPIAETPIGRLEVRRLTGAFTDWRGYYKTRVKIAADAVPLSAFAIALGDALGIPVSVEPALQPVRISMAAADARLLDVLAAIDESYPFWATTGQNMTIEFTAENPHADYETLDLPLRTMAIPVGAAPASTIAELACPFLSSRGSLGVVGQSLLVEDRTENIERIEELVAVFSKILEPGDTVWRCAAPSRKPGFVKPAGVPPGGATARRLECAGGPCLSLRAEAATTGSIAAVIAEALGVVVIVDARLVAQQVTLSDPSLDRQALVDALRGHGIAGKISRSRVIPTEPGDVTQPDTLRLSPAKPREHLALAGSLTVGEEVICEMPSPVHTLLLPLKDATQARQLAQTYCEMVASDHGHVTVAGKTLLVQDQSGPLDQIRELAKALELTPAP